MIDKTLQNTIAETLKNQPVEFAYLVGSQAVGKTTPLSDIDVAVYLDEKQEIFGEASEIATQLQTALGRNDVDVIELNRAGIPVLRSILRGRVAVFIKNSAVEKKFLRRTYQKAVDFQPTMELIGNLVVKRIKSGGS